MASAILSIPSLTDERAALDLSAALMSISGVASVRTDTNVHTLTVEYEPNYLSEGSLQSMIDKTGYPIDGGKGTT